MPDDFGNEVVWALGTFVHNADEAVGAVGALVCGCRCDFSAGWTRAFGKSDKGLAAFLCVSRRAYGESESAEADDEEMIAMDCFHIFVSFYFVFRFHAGFGPQS